MYDMKRIGTIIEDIQKHLSELRSYNILNSSYLEESKTYHASAMLVFAILDRLIDLGTEIVIAEHLGMPQTYQHVMPMLAEANVINREQSEKLNDVIKQRNKIAHLYEEITPQSLFKIIAELSLIEQFLKTIKNRIQQKEKENTEK